MIENDDNDDQVQTGIGKLFDDYKEIETKAIPDGLPLVRSISHWMDLSTGASLVNK